MVATKLVKLLTRLQPASEISYKVVTILVELPIMVATS